jgi:hypothetical protein
MPPICNTGQMALIPFRRKARWEFFRPENPTALAGSEAASMLTTKPSKLLLKEVVDVLLVRSKFSTPTCFGIWLPSSGGRECLISYSSNVLCYGHVQAMTHPVWSVVVEFHNNQPQRTSHSLHTPITQNIAWVAYQALTTPWGWQPIAETCRGREFGTY